MIPDSLTEAERRCVTSNRQAIWGPYAHKSAGMLADHIQRYPGTLFVARLNGEVAGFLVTYRKRTGGDSSRLPPTEEEVWQQGNVPDYDTILMDQMETYKQGAGIASAMIHIAQRDFSQTHLFTYTPSKAVGLHTHHGARAVHIFPWARRHHRDPHVIVTSYNSKELPELTDEQIQQVLSANPVPIS